MRSYVNHFHSQVGHVCEVYWRVLIIANPIIHHVTRNSQARVCEDWVEDAWVVGAVLVVLELKIITIVARLY